jgi:hypothetical protein
MLNEQISDELLPKFSLSLIADFKYKKLEIDKKLDEIVNKKIIQIKKESEKIKTGFVYFNAAYKGEYNKDGMPNGIGDLLFQPSEDWYNGQLYDGLKHGIGKYTYLSGGGSKHHPFSIPYYIGEWFADSYHGLGKHYITEFEFLCIYEGTHTHDKQNGFATYKKFDKGSTEKDCKICNTELIGYFTNGQGFQFMIEINRDDKGNLAKDVPSGLLEYDLENGSKQPLSTFNEISDWDKIKPKKMDKDISDIFNAFYEPYFNLDPFTEKFSDLTLEVKKNVIKLMFDSNKYFEKNAEDKNFSEFLAKVNALNKVINQIGECDKLVELKEKVEDAKKEFVIIEKKLKA